MANKKISELPVAAPLTDNDLFAVVQGISPDLVTKKITAKELGKITNQSIEIEIDDLYNLINTGTLNSGSYYRITFQTKHLIPNTNEIHSGTPEELLILALSGSKISNQAYSPIRPWDIIFVDLTDTVCEDNVTPRNGRIYYRKDTIMNLETWYDWRNVVFRRWVIKKESNTAWAPNTDYLEGDVVYSSGYYLRAVRNHNSDSSFDILYWHIVLIETPQFIAWDTQISWNGSIINADPSQYMDVSTFGLGNDVYNVSIKKNHFAPYNNIVIMPPSPGTHSHITIESGCRDMSITTSAEIFTIKSYTRECIIMGGSWSNTIGSNCQGIFISGGSSNNEIGDNINGLSLVANASNNTIGSGVSFTSLFDTQKNILEAGSSNNKITQGTIGASIGTNSQGNIIVQVSSYSSIGANSNNNLIMQNSTYSIIGNNSNGNTIKQAGPYPNEIGIMMEGNIIGNHSSYNTIEMGGINNQIGDHCSSNSIFQGSHDNYISNNSIDNIISQSSSYNIIGESNDSMAIQQGSTYNKTGAKCSGIAFMSEASGNILGNNNSNSTIKGQNNIIGNGCQTINFVAPAHGNIIGNLCVNISIASESNNNILGNGNTDSIIIGKNNSIGNNCENIQFLSTGSKGNSIGNNCIDIKLTANSDGNRISNNCNTIILGHYNEETQSISSGGYSNNSIESNCTNIIAAADSCYFGESCINLYLMREASNCYFTSGTQNKTFQSLLEGVKFLITDNSVKTYTSGWSFGRMALVSKRSPDGELWFDTIDNSGNVTPVKFV